MSLLAPFFLCTIHLKGSLTLNIHLLQHFLLSTRSQETKFVTDKELSCPQSLSYLMLGKTLSLSSRVLDIKGCQLDIGLAPAGKHWLTLCSCGQWSCHMTLKSKLWRVDYGGSKQRLHGDSFVPLPHLLLLQYHLLVLNFPSVFLMTFEWRLSDRARLSETSLDDVMRPV